MADGLLHGAFEGTVGGRDGQEQGVGLRVDLRKGTPVGPPLLWCVTAGGGAVEEGDGGRREEADGGKLRGSGGEANDVLQGDGAPPN